MKIGSDLFLRKPLEQTQHGEGTRKIRVFAQEFRGLLSCSPACALKQFARRARWNAMSDAYDYFKAHAIAATQKARALPFGRDKQKQRVVARVYHLLAREAAFAPNVHHLDEFRAAQRLERQIKR
jgi:hypothetical protein